MDKVEQTYLAENNAEKFKDFENILKQFNPKTEKAPELYYVSGIFLQNNYFIKVNNIKNFQWLLENGNTFSK